MIKYKNGSRIEMTEQEITYHQQQAALRNAQYESTLWLRKRQNEMPSLSKQFEMIWDDLDKGIAFTKTSNWYQAIKALKVKYPKPE